ncbi:TrkA family potassium uptake protein [candidate division KSB1 bacterium]|nr:MAG: TrkA family potassium uptake protein [candidate division KSB1 bacterium]
MQNIALIGVGKFGYYFARSIKDKVNELVVIDNDEKKINQVKSFISNSIIADATNREVLEQLDLKSMDAVVISMGEKIESSILTTLYLQEMGITNITVKANSEDHAKILLKTGAAHTVFPERESAFRLAYSISELNVLNHIDIAEGYSIIEMAPPSSFEGKSIRELDIRKKYGVTILIVKQIVPEKTIVPTPDFIIKQSDILVIMGKNEDLKKISEIK